MVDNPTPSTPSGYDKGDDGMPAATQRAFQSHADTQLGNKPQQAIREIERVYDNDPDAVVSVSGGKDSMVVLALAAAADVRHRVLHWDWGSRLMPREYEQEIVDAIRQHVPDERLFVAARAHSRLRPYSDHAAFKRGLQEKDGITDTNGSLSRLAGVLAGSDHVGRQILGLRASESGKRARKVEDSGLYGESLGQPAAFPIREWTARDVWAYLVDNSIDYPSHYDRVAYVTTDGHPRGYEDARLSTVHDPEFEDMTVDGHSAWRDHDIKQQ